MTHPIRAALKEQGVTTELLADEGDGHGLANLKSRFDAPKATDFLDRDLRT